MMDVRQGCVRATDETMEVLVNVGLVQATCKTRQLTQMLQA
jgi:hypothetical protein